MSNADKVVDYVLANVDKLEPAKITALASVIKALGGEIEQAPNEMEPSVDPNLIDEEQPLDMSKVTNVVIDGAKKPVKIFNN
jgi:hypothetical protein